MRNFSNTILVFIFGIGLLSILTSCANTDGQESSESKQEGENSRAISVEVMTVSNESFSDFISIIGTVKPFRKADLGYQAGGTLKKLLIDKGNYVRAGDTLAIIDNDVLAANLKSAKAAYDLAQVNFVKQETIFKDRINSEFQLLEAKYNRDQAQGNYELIKAQYDKTFITAPFSGKVDNKFYEEGELVLPGMPIVTLIDISKIKIEAGVPENYSGKVKYGGEVFLNNKELFTQPITGKISYVGSSLTAENRTFPVEILLYKFPPTLKPEMIVELSIKNQDYKNVYIIPEEVITRTDQGYIVFVQKENKAIQKNISIISRFENKVAVKDGLNEGDKLIIVGYQNLVDGESIKIVNR